MRLKILELTRDRPDSMTSTRFQAFSLMALVAGAFPTTSLVAEAFPVSSYSYSISPSGSYPDSARELTDGVIFGPVWPTPVNFADVSFLAGWQRSLPTITFNFSTPVSIASVTAYFADSDGAAGVSLPSSVTLSDGSSFTQTFPVTNPAGSGTMVESVFSGFLVTTDVLTLTYTLGTAGEWTMLSEVQFSGTTAIPEPSTGALGLTGMVLVAAFLGSRRRGSS